MLTAHERIHEAAMINKALRIKAPKGTVATANLDAARTAYIRLLGSLGSNAEVKAEEPASASSSIKCNYGCWSSAPVLPEKNRRICEAEALGNLPSQRGPF